MAMPPPGGPQGPYPPNPGHGFGGGPGYGYGGMPVEHPQGTTILVLGILSIAVCGLLGPFAWSMGNDAMRDIDQNPYAYSNRSSVQAGRICGMVTTCLLIFTVVVILLGLVAGLVLSSSASS